MDPISCKFEIKEFDGKGDFGLWKYKFLGQLELQGLLSVLEEPKETESEETAEGTVKKPKSAEEKQREADKDKRVQSLFSTCLSDNILRKIINEKTALGMWKALERDYQHKSLPNRIYLKKKFSCYRMEESKTIEENVDMFLKLIADLASLQVSISDEDQAIQLLSALPPSYDQLVHTLQYGSGKDTLTVNEVITGAYSKEAELKQKGLLNNKQKNEGLYVEQRGRSANKNNQSNRGRSKSKARGKSTEKSNTGCFVCGEEGHWKRDCPKRKQRASSSANMASNFHEPLVLTVSSQSTSEEWVIDSGSSFHITPNKDLLFDFEEFEGGRVLMGNDTYSEIKGKGKIKIVNPDNSIVVLTDVRYMPTMTRNLISYGMLEKAGCQYSGKGFTVKFYKGRRMVISGNYRNGLYYLQGSVTKQDVKEQQQVLLAEKEADQKSASESSSSEEKKEPRQLKEGKGKRVSFNPVLEQPGLVESSSTREKSQGGELVKAKKEEVADLEESLSYKEERDSKDGLLRRGVKCLSSYLKGVLTTPLLFPNRNQIATEGFCDGDFVGDLDINSKSREAKANGNLVVEEVITKENKGEDMTSVAHTKDNGFGNTPQN